MSNKAAYTSTDVDEELIDWLKKNIPDGEYFTNNYDPPIHVPDNQFDVVFAVSVFTHIPLDHQQAWLLEIRRILKPSGIAIITFLELEQSLDRESTQEVLRPDTGIKRSWLGKDNAPDVYLNFYHTKDFIENEWSKIFEILEFRPRMIRGKQVGVIMRKTS